MIFEVEIIKVETVTAHVDVDAEGEPEARQKVLRMAKAGEVPFHPAGADCREYKTVSAYNTGEQKA